MQLTRRLLDNGLTLLVQPLAGVASVSLGLEVKSGSRDERPGEAGLCHLAEHMFFQGTRRRDTRELARVISAVGGNFDAYTSRESTVFYAKVPAAYLPLAMDVLADILRKSLFAPWNLTKEKRIILEEIRMVEDDPEEYLQDLLSQKLWPHHPLGRSILGTRAQVQGSTRRGLLDFVQRHFQPARMVLALAGRVTPRQARDLAQRYFGTWAGGSADGLDGPLAEVPACGQRVVRRPLEQVHVGLGARGLAYTDRRRLALLALSSVMGGGTNSRLFYEVRERRALAYAVYSYVDFYRDTGIVGVYAACQPAKLRDLLQVLRDELARLAKEPVTRQELKDVREQMRGSLLLSLENSSSHMWRLIQNETYLGRHPSLAATLRAIAALSREEILEVARASLSAAPLTMVVMGPVKDRPLPDLKC